MVPSSKVKIFTADQIPVVIERANSLGVRRDRLLMHSSYDDPIQEMIVALLSDSIVKPHYHPLSSESYYILQGCLEVCWGNDSASLNESIKLDSRFESAPKGLRLPCGIWHSTRAVTDCAVYLEIAAGPFTPEKTIYQS
jgi:cupin fold WbuC family metalloprotein